VGQFLLHPAPVGAPRSEYNTSDKFREVYQTVPAGVGLLCVKIMLDATHLTGSCIVRPPGIGSNRPSVIGDGHRKALPAYISVANQKMATSRLKESRELLSMLAILGQGYNSREKKSVKFKTRSWTLLQEQLEIVILDRLSEGLIRPSNNISLVLTDARTVFRWRLAGRQGYNAARCTWCRGAGNNCIGCFAAGHAPGFFCNKTHVLDRLIRPLVRPICATLSRMDSIVSNASALRNN